jgi:hypothetical protein
MVVEAHSLYYSDIDRGGKSDKVYCLWLIQLPDTDRYTVQYGFGKRTGAIRHGFMFTAPVPLWEAMAALRTQMGHKIMEGYKKGPQMGKPLGFDVLPSTTRAPMARPKGPVLETEVAGRRRVKF